jgi:DNA-binding FadR family transcriptional regulator
MNKILPVKQKTVVFQIMEQLKSMIASGRMKPNDKVPNEYELAQMFGVGRSSIREALKIFQFLGVIELRNPKGTFISESSNISSEALLWSMLLGNKDFKDLIELRLVLENQGLWYLKKFHNNEKLLQTTVINLQQEITSMEIAIDNEDNQQRLIADYNFHKHIIEVCQNDIFNNLYSTMKSFMQAEINSSQSDLLDKKSIIANHNSLIESVMYDDYYTSTEKFRSHIRNFDNLANDTQSTFD